MNIAIVGYKGRMGSAVLRCAQGTTPNIHCIGKEIHLSELAGPPGGRTDVVIDFSSRDASIPITDYCVQHKLPLVMGTTGQTETGNACIKDAANYIPIVKATNFSTGVNTLFWLTRKAAEILGPGFDLEIVEAHHRMKKDAPSGTAKTLATILEKVRNAQHQMDNYSLIRIGREQGICQRMPSEIGVHSIRGGDVVGDHTVMFLGDGERIELTDRTTSRDAFAKGALRAAQWVVGKPPGLYDMQDVLGLK